MIRLLKILLGTIVIASALVAACSGDVESAWTEKCSALAGASFEPGNNSIGIEWDDIDPERAVAVCRDAVDENPSKENLYRLGRALAKSETYDEALAHFEQSAEQEYAPAINGLGFLYFNGYGVAQNDAEAVKWYRKAAEQGHTGAQYNLGTMYETGRNFQQDYALATKWYLKAAEQGLAPAQVRLGEINLKGLGLPQDPGLARQWLEKAASQGNENAIAMLREQDNVKSASSGNEVPDLKKIYSDGLESYKLGNYAMALQKLRYAAERGHAPSQFATGLLYFEAKGVEKNPGEATKWFERAALQGHLQSQLRLGLMFWEGNGVPADMKLAKRWFEEAARQGDADAKAWLKVTADMEASDRAIENQKKEIEKVGELRKQIAETNVLNGRNAYIMGVYHVAREFYQKACNGGAPKGCFELGAMLESGRGGPRDKVRAGEFYDLACEGGYDKGCTGLPQPGESGLE